MISLSLERGKGMALIYPPGGEFKLTDWFATRGAGYNLRR
jgi:hypothetical protein